MASLSNDFENRLLDFIFRGQPFTPPSAIYVALFTTAATDAQPGEEISAPSYARAEVPCSLADWSSTNAPDGTEPSSGTEGVIYNITQAVFPDPLEDWGVAIHVGLFDQKSGGNYLMHAPLASPKDIVAGDANIMFDAEYLSVEIDNG